MFRLQDTIEASLIWDELRESDKGDYLCVATTVSDNTTHTKAYHLKIFGE